MHNPRLTICRLQIGAKSKATGKHDRFNLTDTDEEAQSKQKYDCTNSYLLGHVPPHHWGRGRPGSLWESRRPSPPGQRKGGHC